VLLLVVLVAGVFVIDGMDGGVVEFLDFLGVMKGLMKMEVKGSLGVAGRTLDRA
jgi:hypothetical protein